jgi:uncharacterized surface protein with fasciclin (FAS1) repeats
VNSHIIFGELSESDFVDGTFIETSQSTYLAVGNDGLYAGGDVTPSRILGSEVVSGKGIVYEIDRMFVAPSNSIFDIIADPSNFPQYQKFYQLCYESGLLVLDADNRPTSLDNVSVGTYYSCFIPTNLALEAAIADGSVPEDADSIQQFLRYHFVEGVIFPDGEKSGTFNTTRIDEQSGYLFNTIEILNQMHDLRVKDNLGNIRHVVVPNHIVEDGVIHQIDSCLFFQ